ncbi:hypothetical protein [Variovorax sp.]|jgi:hypothetical protein|uniref:hypothetical protein n=1 Tax=unclassified Variovorax TaxID=663243 RepID=UPI0025D7A481|nr:hypothetical protein [Variovorax sp.]
MELLLCEAIAPDDVHRSSRRFRMERKPDRELAATSLAVAANLDESAMGVDQVATQGQSHAEAASRPAVILLREEFEDHWQQRGINADSRVLHLHHGMVDLDRALNPDLTRFGRALDGVVEQVEEDLVNPLPIRDDRDRRGYQPCLTSQI